MTMREKMARAICAADGVNPDERGFGLGRTMPEGSDYPLWHARLKQVDAALDAMMDLSPELKKLFHDAGWHGNIDGDHPCEEEQGTALWQLVLEHIKVEKD